MVEVSANVATLNKNMSEVQSQLDRVSSMATKMAGVLRAAFSAQAVIGFGRELMADADALTRLSDKTGVSLQGLQRFQIAADDAGNTVDQLTTAISQMENRLSSGDASAVRALNKLGLSLEDLQSLSPENQFVAISEAIRAIHDPALQTQIAIDVFGRSGAEILPTLKRGFDDVKDAAVGMSDATIRALDEAGDAMTAFWRETKAYAAEGLVALMHAGEGGFNPIMVGAQNARREVEALRQEMQRMADAIPKPKGLPQAAPLPGISSDGAQAQAQMRESAAIMAELGKRQRALEEATRQAREESGRYQESLERLGAALYDVENPATDVIHRMHQLTTLGVAEKVVDWEAAFRGVRDRLAEIEQQGIPAVFTQGTLTSVGQHVEVVATHVRTLGQNIRGAFDGVGAILDNIGGKFAEFGAVVARTGSAIMSNLASGNILGAITAGVTGAITAIGRLWHDAEDDVSPVRDAWFEAAGGLAAVNQAAMEATGSIAMVQAVLDAKNPEAYTAAIKALDAAMAHLADLKAGAAQFGPSNEDLINAEKRAREIFDFMQQSGQYTADQLSQAYYAWQKAMAAAGNTAAQEWVRLHDAVQTGAAGATAAMQALQQQRDALANSIAGEAPEEVMGVIEAQTRGQMAALDQQLEDQRRQLEAQGEAAANDLQDTLERIDPDAIHVPIIWDIPTLPGVPNTPSTGPSYSSPSRSQSSSVSVSRGREGMPELHEEIRRLRSYMTTQFKRDVARAVRDSVATR